MLGEMIGEERGRITGIRVLPSEGQGPVIEVSFQDSGKLLGLESTDMGTYQSVLTPAGVFRGKGQGILTTKDGDMVAWTGEGVGKPKGQGLAASWRGAVYYQTASARLANLNGLAGLFEYEIDENGNTQNKVWEWK